jgi:hypothetical protein
MAHQPLPRPVLVIQRGPQPGRAFGLDKNVLSIGRAADNDIVIDDPHVSRHHARLIRWGDGWVIEDLGSPNGVVVNGHRIAGRVMLDAGSHVALGSNVLFTLTGAYAPAAASVRPKKAGRRIWWLVPVALALIALLVGAPMGLLWLAGRAADVREQPPRVAVRALQTGDRVAVDRAVLVEAVAMDDEGVTQIELWVDGELVDVDESPDSASPAPALVPLEWQPDSPGTHTVVVRATNGGGVVNQEAIVVEAVEDLVAVDAEGREITIADVSEVYYVAGDGDTLDTISRMYDVDAAEIVALNPDLDPVALAPGAVVAVPFDAVGFLEAREAEENGDEDLADGRGGGPPAPPVFAPDPPDLPGPPGAPPDLVITNLTLSNHNPSPGEAITVGVTILNAGGTPAESFSWSWGPGTGEGRIEAEPPIDFLAPGDDVVREMTYTYQDTGAYTGRARVDPGDAVDEGDGEDNNTALADVTVGTVPAGSVDLAITNLTLSDYAPAPGDEITVGVTIANLGDATAEDFTWAWCSGTGEGCQHVGPPIDFLAPGDDVVREIQYVYAEAGRYAAHARADSHAIYDEGEDEENNVARAEVDVGGVAAGDPVDLAITNLTLSALNPRPGEEVVVGVTIANLGGMPAEDVDWSYYPGAGLPYVRVEEPIPLLAPGEDVMREITYVYEREGTYSASAVVDPWGDYPQDDDNEAWAEVRVDDVGASVGPAASASSGGLSDLGDWAQDLADVPPPAAPHIISTQLHEATDYGATCYTVLEWRDRSDNESGFKVYRWDTAWDGFALIATLAPNDAFDIVQYADTTTTPDFASAGPTWYYVVAYNGGGEAASNYATVEITPACVGGGWSGLSGAEIEFVGMIVDQHYDDFYCYLSLDDSPWFRVPDSQDAFMPVEYGPIEDDLFGMGESGESYYHVNLFDYLGGWNSLVIYPSRGDSFSVGLECFGWRDGRLHDLGTYTKEHPYETWDDEVATGWLEEAQGPDGWFAFWYATRQALVYRGEETPTLFDDSLPAPIDPHIVPEDCAWWHDSCTLRWRWAGDSGKVDSFHVEDDRKGLDVWLDPGYRSLDIDPLTVYPYPYCGDNEIEVAAYRDVHRGQPAYADITDEACAGRATVDVHFEEVQFSRVESPGVLNNCMDDAHEDIQTVYGYIRVGGLEKKIEFGPVGIGETRDGIFASLTVPPCAPVDLGGTLSQWNPWIEGGRVYPRLGDGDSMTVEWRFYADIYDEDTGFIGVNKLVCAGEKVYGPLGVLDWEALHLQTQLQTGVDDYGDYKCQVRWSINW